MDNKKLKSDIYKMLENLDEEGLQMVNDMVSDYLKKSEVKDGWDSLSEEDKAAIEEGLEQLDKGMTIPHEEVMERLDKKFGFR